MRPLAVGSMTVSRLGQLEAVLARDLHADEADVRVLADHAEVEVALADSCRRLAGAALVLVDGGIDGVGDLEVHVPAVGLDDRRRDVHAPPESRQVPRVADCEALRHPGHHELFHDERSPRPQVEGLALVVGELDHDDDVDAAVGRIDLVDGRGLFAQALGLGRHGQRDRQGRGEREQDGDEGAAGPGRHGTFLVCSRWCGQVWSGPYPETENPASGPSAVKRQDPSPILGR